MKITFTEQAIREAERKRTEKNRETRAHGAAAAQASYGAFFGRMGGEIPGMGGERGKSLIDLQQEAENADVGLQRDYMTVASHTMSDADYAKLQEEGFDFGSMDPEEAVTIVDRIKAELARAGKNIPGYTDDMDMKTLAAALGRETLARTVLESFRAEDVPVTKENITAIAQAWEMSSGLQPLEEGTCQYLIDNGLEAEIWNLYLAQSSGAGKGGSAPMFYAEDVKGYYAQSAGKGSGGELQDEVDRVIRQSGRPVDEDRRRNAFWLLDRGLPLTAENLDRLEDMMQVELPVTEERFGKAVASAVAEGKSPVHASLSGKEENLYEKAAAISEYYHSSELWEASVGDITARRQLEEVRLRMTAEVNVKLLRSGFSIDTAPMEELIEALKMAGHQVANQYFPRDSMAIEKYHNYRRVSNVTDQLPGLPADVLGMFAKGEGDASLETIYNEGKTLQSQYEKAQQSYEKLMTAPRGDMGDSIEKAFASVDHILKDMGAELTEENRRAVRILGYNQMEMTQENLNAVKEADRQVQGVLEKLTPAATLKMIRDGFNPLEKSFGELEQYFKNLPPEYKKEAESYSRFLYGLERNNEITPEERESYIGIYRLVRQIEKAEGAAVGALVNAQAEIHFSNLLSALQNGRRRSLDVRVPDELGDVPRPARTGESITEQISRAFVKTVADIRAAKRAAADAEISRTENVAAEAAESDSQAAAAVTEIRREPVVPQPEAAKAEESALKETSEAFVKVANDVLTEVSPDEKATTEYNKAQLEEQRQAVNSADQESISMLQRGALPSSADNLMGAQALNHGMDNIFELADRRRTGGRKQKPAMDIMQLLASKAGGGAEPEPAKEEPETGSAALWQKLDDREGFAEDYERLTRESLESVEEATFEEAESSVDVKNMQLSHKQLTVAAALAKREEYYLPLYLGDRLTRVHLTLDRGSREKGTVTIGVTLSEEEHMQARLYLEKGMVHGMLFGEGKVDIMKVRQIADNFKKEAEGSWQVGNITTIASERRMPALVKSGEHNPTDSAELYRVAKVFLQSVVQTAEA